MSDVTRILSQIESGDPAATEQLLPLVYNELRKLAAAKLAQENPGQTLQATALVHEAYVRLVDAEQVRDWNSRGHFFAAAAEAMRRILIESARRKNGEKHGGDLCRIELSDAADRHFSRDEELLILDDALSVLAGEDPAAADLAKLRVNGLFAKGGGFESTEMPAVQRSTGRPNTPAHRNRRAVPTSRCKPD
jgi:RNA polymerase sigma factor (TIGR02999 family)